MDGVGETAATTPSDVSFFLLRLRCYDIVSGIMVEQRGLVKELFGSCSLWFWWRRRAIEDGDPKEGKVVRGSRIWRDLSTSSMAGGRSKAREARERSPADMPQRYVAHHVP